jgi:hypothetical protein
MNNVDTMLARAQVGLAFLFALGFFALLGVLLMVHREMTPTELTILTGLVSVLGTLLALMMNFFFARTRPAALPDPATTTTTSTTTTTPMATPTAVTTTVTPSPLAQPLPEK